MGTKAAREKCDPGRCVCPREPSVAARIDSAAHARRNRHGKSLSAERAKPLWTRVAGRDRPPFGEGGIGEMAEEGDAGEAVKRPTFNSDKSRAGAQRRTPNERF